MTFVLGGGVEASKKITLKIVKKIHEKQSL